jgi:hypothetical protein
MTMLFGMSSFLWRNGIGTLGVDIFLGAMPDKPDNCIALFEYAGSPPDLHWNGEYPGLQVRVRNKSYAAARKKIDDITTLLNGLYEKLLGGDRILLIKARGSPELLKRDYNNRVEVLVNFEIILERVNITWNDYKNVTWNEFRSEKIWGDYIRR